MHLINCHVNEGPIVDAANKSDLGTSSTIVFAVACLLKEMITYQRTNNAFDNTHIYSL